MQVSHSGSFPKVYMQINCSGYKVQVVALVTVKPERHKSHSFCLDVVDKQNTLKFYIDIPQR